MKRINKLFTTVLALGLVATTFSTVACKKEEQVVEKDNSAVKLTNNSLSLCVGETFLLGATISGGSASTTLVYKSLDESIATINENGFIKALKPGTTEIRAIYGSALAKCKITVELKDNVPTIEFKNIADKSIQIDKSTRFDVEPVILYNNNYYAFEPTFKVSDTSVAEMEGKTFIPKSNGVAYLTVEGKFFGTTAVSATIEIIIKDNVIIYMKNENGVERSDIYLYSVGQIDEEIFQTEFTPMEFGVVLNGEKVQSPNLSVELVNEDNVVNYDSTTYKISSTTTVGTAQYIVTYVDDESNTYVKTFDIYNNKSVFTYKGDAIETDVTGGNMPVDQIFADFSSKVITKATSLDGEIDYVVKDGKVIGLPVIRNEVTGEVQTATYILYNDTVGFKVNLTTYTKFIQTAKDLEALNLTSLDAKLDGYYVLANDIDGETGGSYYQLPAHTRTMGNAYSYYPAIGLIGTFDGRGHTIEHISLGEGGLFGNIGNGGVVKNVCVKNVTYRLDNGKDDTPTLACYMNGSTLENVCISNDYISARYNAGLVANNIMSNCSIRNCYFDLQIADKTRIISNNYGVFGSMCGERKNLGVTFTNTYTNVVVNSNIPLIYSSSNSYDSVGNDRVLVKFICDVEGHPFEIGDGFVECNLVSDITRYYTNEEMKNSGNDFKSFNQEYWHVEDGMLCWGHN